MTDIQAAVVNSRCPIFLAPFVDPRCCDACNTPLPGRRQRWCSDECWQRYFRNHAWGDARRLAIRRASAGYEEPAPVKKWNDKTWKFEDTGETYMAFFSVWVICDACGRECTGRSLEDSAEVNHVDPRVGRDLATPGCWNHATNLQVLCHTCHVEETNRQVAERRGVARAAAEPTQPMWDAA